MDFYIEQADGTERQWHGSQQGNLTYTEDGRMSVEIVRAPPDGGDLDEADRKRLHIWYDGRYSLQGGAVIHHIEKASDPSRIGQDIVRYLDFKNDQLVITGRGLNSVQVRLIWERGEENI